MLEKIVNFGIVYLSIGAVMGIIIFCIALYIIISVIKEMKK